MKHVDPSAELTAWLQRLESLPLECDGLSRITSALLERDGVPHRQCVGSLMVVNRGTIPMHMWLELEDGLVFDLRARMWLGEHDDVPHGIFTPQTQQQYILGRVVTGTLDPVVFQILAMAPMNNFSPFPGVGR